MPYLLFLKRQQNLKLLSAANCMWHFLGKKITLSNTIKVSNNLDPVPSAYFVGPDLGSNCFQRLSADDTSRQRVKLTANQIAFCYFARSMECLFTCMCSCFQPLSQT